MLITIPGNPSGATINKARRAGVVKRGKHRGKPMTYSAKKAKTWRGSAVLVVRAAWSRRPKGTPMPRELEITTHWPRIRRKGPAAGEPLGDVDATVKAVLDVLKGGGVVPDDAVLRRVVLVNAYDAKRPRIEVRFGNDAAVGVVADA
jgi:Holliday junction resolvase RusA-like endonuclease